MASTGPSSEERHAASLTIQKFSSRGIGYSVADWSDVRHIFAAAVPRRGTTLAEQTDDALRIIETVNSVHGAHGTIVRQAVFVSDPASIDKCRRTIRQFYGRDLPATSYIAQPPCEGKLIAIEALGLGAGRGDLKVERISEQLVIARHNGMIWIENPRQTAAYRYGACYSPQSPKFSRAMAVTCGPYAMVFISGTASITASETRHVGDAAAQTRETLDNIEALIGEENLAHHGLPGRGTTLAGIGLARVYIKRKDDYERVRAVCERRLGELPTVYAVADICRPDLLVEIEGLALSRNALVPRR